MKKGISILLAVILAVSTQSLIFADSLQFNKNTFDDTALSTNGYTCSIKELGNKTISYVYDKSNRLVGSATYNKNNGMITSHDFTKNKVFKAVFNDKNKTIDINDYNNKNIEKIYKAKKGKSKYKFLYSQYGKMTVAKWTLVGVIAGLAALVKNPKPVMAVIVAVATAIISDGLSEVNYKISVYGYKKGKTYHFKRVFKFYNRKTKKQLGPLVTTYNIAHK